MKIIKASQGGENVAVTAEELALINRQSRRELKPEEVYTFAVRLCDNEIDRDCERFPEKTLRELAELFVGKSGIFDHSWSARGQSARVYRTEVVEEPGRTTGAGDGYRWLKGCAYMVRTESSKDLIAEIEGGIKREVSVGCAVERSVCSICGEDMGACSHEKGREYGGQLCWASLEGAKDAYEFSFVAVPAQRQAGVVKGLCRECRTLAQAVQCHPGCAGELERLEKQAALGRRYLDRLRGEVLRLGALAERDLDARVLRSIAEKLDEGELLALQKAFAARTQEKFAIKPQLRYAPPAEPSGEGDGAFLI